MTFLTKFHQSNLKYKYFNWKYIPQFDGILFAVLADVILNLSFDVVTYLVMCWLIWRCGGLSEYLMAYQEMWQIIGILDGLSGDVVDYRNIM